MATRPKQKPAFYEFHDVVGSLSDAEFSRLQPHSADLLRGKAFTGFEIALATGSLQRLQIGKTTKALGGNEKTISVRGAVPISVKDFRKDPNAIVTMCHSIQRVLVVGDRPLRFFVVPRKSEMWLRISSNVASALQDEVSPGPTDSNLSIASELTRIVTAIEAHQASTQTSIRSVENALRSVGKETGGLKAEMRHYFGNLTKLEVLAAAAGQLPDDGEGGRR